MLFWRVQIQILKTDVYIIIYIYINTYPTPEAHTLLNWDALVGFPQHVRETTIVGNLGEGIWEFFLLVL